MLSVGGGIEAIVGVEMRDRKRQQSTRDAGGHFGRIHCHGSRPYSLRQMRRKRAAKVCRMPKIDIAAVPARQGSGYPPPFDAPCATRTRRRLGDAGGLRDFGVNLMTLPPGGWSSQRHWHSHEDEFVYVLEGE